MVLFWFSGWKVPKFYTTNFLIYFDHLSGWHNIVLLLQKKMILGYVMYYKILYLFLTVDNNLMLIV